MAEVFCQHGLQNSPHSVTLETTLCFRCCYLRLGMLAPLAETRRGSEIMLRICLAMTSISLSLSGCTTSSGARMGLFTATAPVYAVMYDELLLGKAVGYMDRTGTINIASAVTDGMRCVGEFRYTGMRTGEADLRCNDGTIALIRFNAISSLSGYGIGSTSRGPVSFTFGMNLDKAEQYLVLPKGKRIDRSIEDQPRLIDTGFSPKGIL